MVAIEKEYNRSGFTLVETLVVVFLLGLIIAIGGGLFFSILKGASKAEITKTVKQNGDYAINIMERTIRNAKKINSCTVSSISVMNPNTTNTVFSFSGGRIASDSGFLTNSNLTANGSFNCTAPTPPPPPSVTIYFTLSGGGANARPEEKIQILFKKTVLLRTY